MGAGVLQTFCKAYAHQAQESALNAQGVLSKQLSLLNCKVTNKSSGTCDLGILRGLGSGNWSLASVVANAATDITAAIQAGTASTLFSTTDADGFIVSSKHQFGLVGFTLSQAQTGSPVYTYKYWNGSAWTTLPVITGQTAYTGTAYKFSAVFLPPTDWAVGGAGGITGVPAQMYNILVQASTAPSQAVEATAAVVAEFIDYAPTVAQYGSLSWPQLMVRDDFRLQFESGDYLLPYFGTAAAGNSVSGAYLVDY